MDRRDFLKIMGVATGTSVAAGCNLDRNSEKLIPYLVPPDDGRIPGDAMFKATTCTECGAACSATARILEDRPVKLDGTAGHPINDGALCLRGQASLNRLYHTERIRQPLMADENGDLRPATWEKALTRVIAAMPGSGTHLFLSRHTTGSLSAMIDEFCRTMGVERLPEYEWYSHAAIREANRELFGIAAVPVHRIDKADFLLSIGADVLDTFQNPVASTLAVSARVKSGHFTWYHAEPHVSMTGFQSRHHLIVEPGSEAYLLAYLARELRDRRIFTDRRIESHLAAVPVVVIDDVASATGLDRHTIETLAADFIKARHPLIVAGGVSTAQASGLDVARLCSLLQLAAGMMGSTVDFAHAQDQSRLGSLTDMAQTARRLEGGGVGAIFVHDTDPVDQLSDGEAFAAALKKARIAVGIGDTLNATMSKCAVVLPLSHSLESWGDAEPRRGTINAIQPAFAPLFDTRSAGDILISLIGAAGRGTTAASYQEYVMARWQASYSAQNARQLLDRGWIETSVPDVTPSLRTSLGRYAFTGGRSSGDVLVVSPSLRWYDGRSADLPLLKEIPDPLSTVTWDRWLSISMDAAARMGLKDGDEVEVALSGWSDRLPVRRQPGLPAGVYSIHKGIAAVPSTILEGTGEGNACVAGVSVQPTGRRIPTTILAGSLGEEGRGVVPGHHPTHFGHPVHEDGHQPDRKDVTFNPEPRWKDYRWAMAIDMDLCTGCSACVASCYIENNVPMVGRDEHLKGREMSWIRIEPYYDEEGGGDFVPTMCQHCDNAPCEAVCPVFATFTNDEGLNAQIYNRCVGTRYCSNNCPYKQRRFNWFNWAQRPEPLGLMTNPDVSVRDKGIMEKCSFCVQRIRKARDLAKDGNRKIAEGEVVPACAQACPGNAIAFGNLLDENSEISRWAKSDRSNRLLEEVGTGPAVYYLTSKGNQHDA